MRSAQKGRRRAPRSRVFYLEGKRLRPADLIYRDHQPVLVIRWRTAGTRRVPDVAFAVDEAHLHPVPHREGEFVYRGPLKRTS